MVSVAAGLIGIALAAWFYLISPAIPEGLARTFSTPYRWIYNKYFVDEFYDSLVVEPMVDGSRSLLWRVVDAGGIDGIVNGAGQDRAQRRRHPQADAIRFDSKLRGLGGAGLDPGDRRDRHRGRRADDAPRRRPVPAADRLPAAAADSQEQSRPLAHGRAGDFAGDLRDLAGTRSVPSAARARRLHLRARFRNGSALRPSAITSASTA